MSRNAIAYRRAGAGDIAALRSMHRASLGALGSAHYSPRQIAGLFLTSETVEPELIADGTFFVAESGGRIVGSAAWTRRRPATRRTCRARRARTARPRRSASVFVAPDRARQGIAGALMDIVESDAVLHGGAIRLELLATLPGVAFYQRARLPRRGRRSRCRW